MKKTLFILYLFSTLCYSQTLKGIITQNPMAGIGDETELSEKAKKAMYYAYTFSNRISLQELISKEETSVDTVMVEHPEIKDLKKGSIMVNIRSTKTIYYKDYNTNVYRFESSRKNRYLITENTSIKDEIPIYNWILEDKSQTIAGYLCKKAKTERTLFGRKQYIIAWYCEDLPINDGPMDFNGLPGLILQIEIGNMNIIKFEKLKFLKDENTTIDEPVNQSPMLNISQYERKVLYGN
tara:strand:- start:2732 stop:3445 length:714 start_codon:yes stop_codon:yes gene_type:complete